MEYTRNGNHILLRLDKGDEVLSSLQALSRTEHIQSGLITGFGAVDHVTIGIFRTADKQYQSVDFKGEFEIASLTGNISVMNDEPYLHVHISVSDPVTDAFHGGHLNYARVSATAEIGIVVLDMKLGRTYNGEIGLNLLDFS